MVYPNTWILWLLWLLWILWILWFIISLCMANKEKWTKSFADLLVLGLAYIIFIFTANSFTLIFIFSQPSERNTFTILSLCMDHVHIANIFRFQLRHPTSLIKLTLLQLHHRTSLTIIMLITRDPLTPITRALLTFTTRAHYIHDTFYKLPLLHSNILFHSSVFVHLQIRPVSQLPFLSLTFPSPTHKSDSSPICKYIQNTSNLLLLSNDVETNPSPQSIDQNPVFCCICYNKINHGIQQDTAPTCSIENCNTRCHQACSGLSIHQTIKLAMQKTLVAL